MFVAQDAPLQAMEVTLGSGASTTIDLTPVSAALERALSAHPALRDLFAGPARAPPAAGSPADTAPAGVCICGLTSCDIGPTMKDSCMSSNCDSTDLWLVKGPGGLGKGALLCDVPPVHRLGTLPARAHPGDSAQHSHD